MSRRICTAIVLILLILPCLGDARRVDDPPAQANPAPIATENVPGEDSTQKEEERPEPIPEPFTLEIPSNPWLIEEEKEAVDDRWQILPEEPLREESYLAPWIEALNSWDRAKEKPTWSPKKKRKRSEGFDLPFESNLKITGHKSITIGYNKTHYFGDSDVSGFYGGGGYSSGYSSGLDFGFPSDYGYDSYGYGSGTFGGGYSSYGSSYGSYGSYSGYGAPRATGLNIEQELVVGLHGRIGNHTNVSVDYSDAGSDYYGGMSNKEQKIRVWYEGNEDSIIKRVSFGDTTLDLPNVRFLNVNRNLFGVEMLAEMAGVKLRAFGSRSKGIHRKRTFRGESRRAGNGTGNRILDTNYVKERYYAINVNEEGNLASSHLPVKQGSEIIFVDDGNGGNNQGGINTAKGYFNQLFPGQDYNIDYQTGEIEFLTSISARYVVVAAYEYLVDSDGDGTPDLTVRVGNPDETFIDDNNNGSIDEDEVTDPVGYVVLKEANLRGTELRNVYPLGDRNINPLDLEITIWREGGANTFQTDQGAIPYLQIFGLDDNGDGLVDPDFVDYERGLLKFPTQRPFVIDDPESPYFKYADQLNNEAIYAENLSYSDQLYTIQADYSYQSDSFNVGLFVIPGSETVRLNTRTLRRDVDYMMIYEVGSINFFVDINEFDEIEIEYEQSPFGGALQQTVAGVWAEYEWRPTIKAEPTQTPTRSQFDQYRGSSSSSFGNDSGYSSYSGGYDSGYDSSSNYGSYGSSYGGSYGGSYGSSYGSSFSSYSSRRSYSTLGGSSFNPSYTKGFKLITGYIYNTGKRSAEIPDVNEAPSRLQAFDINTSLGHTFNIAPLVNWLPLIQSERFALDLNFSGESAYSHNNPNSVGYALIDSMEGVRDSSTIPTFKYNWKLASRPLREDITLDNRVIFPIVPRDENDRAAVGSYMRNKEVPASSINPLAQSVEQKIIMEVGYELTLFEKWGGFSYGISDSGADYLDREFLEIWVRVQGDDAITLHIDIGTVSEDTDEDGILDSEDLPTDLHDANGDGKLDVLDLDLSSLPENQKRRANGSLDSGEDVGWPYDPFSDRTVIGADNTVLDAEDLNGDMVLDTVNSYFTLEIPLNAIPDEWLKRRNDQHGWVFLSIPLREALAVGRPPNWGFVKHIRLWIEQNELVGTTSGIFQWTGLEIVGNRWTLGTVTDANGTVLTGTDEKFIVGAKDNYNFEDYLTAYDLIKNDDDFENLHPFVDSGFGFQSTQQREQSLSLDYRLNPTSVGVTSRQLRGQRAGDGQDFSRYDTLGFWIYGDKNGTLFVMRLGSNVRLRSTSYYSYSNDPFADPTNQQDQEVNIFEQGLTDYYEYTLVVDFQGWKKIEIPLTDADEDGQPDGLVSVGNPSITNVGGILLGIENVTQLMQEGEIWVNEIHLTDPRIRSGWARRGNFSVGLGNLLSVNGGYSSQDSDFESSAGQTGRSSLQQQGYSVTNNDANLDATLTLLPWLPVRYSVQKQESESESRTGSISSYQSGKSESTSRNLGLRFDLQPLPQLRFDYSRQNFWNELRGRELSALYVGSFNYDLRGRLALDTEYRHEDLEKHPEDATNTTNTSYYSYREGDEKTDSGSVSLRITPITQFTLNPSYDIRRTLTERTDSNTTGAGATTGTGTSTGTGTGTEEPAEPTTRFELSAREHRLSLTPRLNTEIFGIRPSVTTRGSVRENWFSGQKDVSVDGDVRVGFSIRPKSWFRFGSKEKGEGGKEGKGDKSSGVSGVQEPLNPLTSEPLNPLSPLPESGDGTSTPTPSTTVTPPVDAEAEAERLAEQERQEEERRQRELDRLRSMGVDTDEIMEQESQRSDWILRDKQQLERRLQQRGQVNEDVGLLQRTIESLSFNIDINWNVRDYLRRVDPAMNILDLLKLPDEAEERSRSSNGQRFSSNMKVDPFRWMGAEARMSQNNDFSKYSGTSSRTKSQSYEGSLQFFSEDKSSSFQLRYQYSLNDRTNLGTQISDSVAHEPSLSWRQRWAGETNTSLGVRVSRRDQTRSAIDSTSLVITPSFNIDYRWDPKEFYIPLLNRRLRLKQSLSLQNTLSTVIRRAKYGVNRDEKSERYDTSLRVNYDLSQRLHMNLDFRLSYNNDHVEEGRDYISASGSVRIQGEFQ